MVAHRHSGEVCAIAAEALGAEVVRHAAAGNFSGAGVEVGVIDVDTANTNDEAVTGERAARKFARVGVGFEDVEFGVADSRQAPRKAATSGP